jgi:hypothetical protein
LTITRVGLGIVLFAVVLVFLMINVQNLYAGAMTLTPNQVTQGASFQVSGTGLPPGDPFSVSVFADTSGSCMPFPPLMGQTGIVDSGGNTGPVTFSSGSLGIGRHCVSLDVPGVFLEGLFLTVIPAQSIPEYPFGLFTLAILMILGYGLIRRRKVHGTKVRTTLPHQPNGNNLKDFTHQPTT